MSPILGASRSGGGGGGNINITVDKSGCLRLATVTITSFLAAQHLLHLRTGDTIVSVRVKLLRHFDDPLTTITIGTDLDPEAFMAASDNRPTFPDDFEHGLEYIMTGDTDIKVFVNTTYGMPGFGEASIVYITKE